MLKSDFQLGEPKTDMGRKYEDKRRTPGPLVSKAMRSMNCTSYKYWLKGCDLNFEVNIFQILKVATKETSTLPKCSIVGLCCFSFSNAIHC